MKNKTLGIITALILALLSTSSFAMLLVEHVEHRQAENDQVLTTGLSLTTIPPLGTLLLGDSTINLSTEEAQVRLVSEANGDIEELLISKIAEQLKTSKENIAKSILAIDSEGQEISLENIQNNLK